MKRLVAGILAVILTLQSFAHIQIVYASDAGQNNTKDALITQSNALNDAFLYELNEDGTCTITKYTGEDTNIEIPSELDGYEVGAIGDKAFDSCSTIISVTVPNTVINIGDRAFRRCTSLKNISIPDSVLELGENAFGECTSLEHITIPKEVVAISSSLFDKCSSLADVILPDGLIEIGKHAFSACSSLKSIVFPDSIMNIDDRAFSGCSSLESVKIPKKVKILRESVFWESGLSEIEIPNGVKEIGFGFCYFTKIKHVYIPDSVTDVLGYAFGLDIESVSLPEDTKYHPTMSFVNYNGFLLEEKDMELRPAPVREEDNSPEKYEIIFHPSRSGATVSLPSKQVINGDKYGELPNVERENYTFKGWYTKVYGGTKITADKVVDLRADQRAYAHWTKNGEEKDDEETDDQDKLKEYSFKYQSDNQDYSAMCWYTDDYFKKSSYTYDHSLATMSLCLAMSAYGSGKNYDYEDKSFNVKELLKKIGFNGGKNQKEQIDTNEWFRRKPTADSIGVAIGNKSIQVDNEDYKLIAVAIRGGGYESEWASNFKTGSFGKHQGFQEAKDEVIRYIKQYISEKNITGKVKFWITGYSRAAATANLVGAEFDLGIDLGDNLSYLGTDIYTYCFETPAGALKSEAKGARFNNIFNLLNVNDPVPNVAPAAWGFCRYGVDKYFPALGYSTNYEKYKKRMLEQYKNLPSTGKYIIDDFQKKRIAVNHWLPGGEKISLELIDDSKDYIPQGIFIKEYIGILANDIIKSRANYTDKYQDFIGEICVAIYDEHLGEKGKKLIDSFTSIAQEYWQDLMLTILDPFSTKDDVIKHIRGWLSIAFIDAGISGYNEQKFEELVNNLSDLFWKFLLESPRNYITSLISNADGIKGAHIAELCYAWMTSMDKNYVADAEESFHKGQYRGIYVNCNVDLEVTDKYGNIVAAIRNEEPQEIYGSDIVSAINEDGEKTVFLPVDTEFDIRIIGRADGDMVNYTINEYSAYEGTCTRTVNYFDVKLNTGEILSGSIPAYSEKEIENDTSDGSSVVYALFGQGNQLLTSDSDLKGNAAINARCFVTVDTSDSEYGIVLGTGARQYGNFAQVEAVPNENAEFIGWYDGSQLVSEETIYRFAVLKNTELTAQFKKKSGAETEETPSDIKITELSIMEKAKLKNGSTMQLAVEIIPSNATNKTLLWSSDNLSVAIVNNKGLVTATGVGQATITATSTDGSNISASCIVTVEKSPSNTDDSKPNDRPGGSTGSTYPGGTTPGTTVSPNQDQNTENDSNNTDSTKPEPDNELAIKLLYYIVSFEPNGGTKLSRKTMTLLNDDNLGILPKVQRRNYSFSGWYTQKFGGQKVSESTILNAGTTLYAHWSKVAKPAKSKVSALKSSKTGKIAVTLKKVTGIKGYEIYYSTNKKFTSSSTSKVTSMSTKKTLKNLKKGKTYYIKVRAYKTDSTGKKVYGAYSSVKKIKVNK